MSASQLEVRAPARVQWRRLCLPSFALAAITALILWAAVANLLQQGRLETVLSAGWAELAAPLNSASSPPSARTRSCTPRGSSWPRSRSWP